jgi:hypothetical protein
MGKGIQEATSGFFKSAVMKYNIPCSALYRNTKNGLLNKVKEIQGFFLKIADKNKSWCT